MTPRGEGTALSSTESNEPSIILLSGPIAVGKSAIADSLINNYDYAPIKSGRYLSRLANDRKLDGSRSSLQALGDALDSETDYTWLALEVAIPALAAAPTHKRWLIDSVRKIQQVQHFREVFGTAIFHAHVTAADPLLKQRYMCRLTAGDEYTGDSSYDEVIRHPNEIAARALTAVADAVFDATDQSPDTIARQIFGFQRD